MQFLAEIYFARGESNIAALWEMALPLRHSPESLLNAPQFHIFVFRLAQRRFGAHAVVLQVTVAIFIDQNTAFAAANRHQDTEPGRPVG